MPADGDFPQLLRNPRWIPLNVKMWNIFGVGTCFGVGSLAAPWWNASTCCYFWNAFAYKPWNASLFLSLLTFFLSLQQAWAAWQRQPFLTPLCWQPLNNREWVHCVTAELSIFLPKSSCWHCHCQTVANGLAGAVLGDRCDFLWLRKFWAARPCRHAAEHF